MSIIALAVGWSTVCVGGDLEDDLIISAAKRGEIAEVKALLAKGAEVNA